MSARYVRKGRQWEAMEEKMGISWPLIIFTIMGLAAAALLWFVGIQYLNGLMQVNLPGPR